jgi:cytochrome P450
MLAYILREPGLIDVVREETKPAFQHLQVDFQYLNDDCPKLAALWNETIRMTSYSASVRYVTEDTFIGGKLLRKGNRLMIPYRQLHFDERIFGDTANTFEADRFIKKKNLTRSDSWRPFGGGLTMCPGRYIAKQAVIMFVAMVLHRFDIELADEQQSFPEPELGKPVLGIMSNKSRQDLKVRLSPTKSRS